MPGTIGFLWLQHRGYEKCHRTEETMHVDQHRSALEYICYIHTALGPYWNAGTIRMSPSAICSIYRVCSVILNALYFEHDHEECIHKGILLFKSWVKEPCMAVAFYLRHCQGVKGHMVIQNMVEKHGWKSALWYRFIRRMVEFVWKHTSDRWPISIYHLTVFRYSTISVPFSKYR